MIPMVDLKAQYGAIQDEVEAAVLDVLRSGWYVMGPHHDAFEEEAAAYVGVKHALGVASGTDAVHLALRAAGVGAGDEVVTTAFTFVGTVEPILYIGAKPVYVDIDPVTFNIDPAAIESAITSKTRAIVPVHLFGLPADMGPILEIAERHGLAVVEDAAQSIGARWGSAMTGGVGDVGAFSFYPTKNLSAAGDAGMITTDSDEIAAHVRSLRNHGSRRRYYHDEVGYNSRLDEVQAAVLRVKLKHVEAYNEGRRSVARHPRPHRRRPRATPDRSRARERRRRRTAAAHPPSRFPTTRFLTAIDPKQEGHPMSFFTDVPRARRLRRQRRCRRHPRRHPRRHGLPRVRPGPDGRGSPHGRPPPHRGLLLAQLQLAGGRHLRRRDLRSSVARARQRPDGGGAGPSRTQPSSSSPSSA